MTDDRGAHGIPFRAMIPNAITLLALCFGLTGVSLAIGGEWDKALAAIVFAGVLDSDEGDQLVVWPFHVQLNLTVLIGGADRGHGSRPSVDH